MSVMKALEHSAFRIHRKLIISVRPENLALLPRTFQTFFFQVGGVFRPRARDAGIEPC